VIGERVTVHRVVFAWLLKECDESYSSVHECFKTAMHVLYQSRPDPAYVRLACARSLFAMTCALHPGTARTDSEFNAKLVERHARIFMDDDDDPKDKSNDFSDLTIDEKALWTLMREPATLTAVRFRMYTNLRFSMWIQLPPDLEWSQATLHLGATCETETWCKECGQIADTSSDGKLSLCRVCKTDRHFRTTCRCTGVHCIIKTPWNHVKSVEKNPIEPDMVKNRALLTDIVVIQSPNKKNKMKDGGGNDVLTVIEGNHRMAQWVRNGSPRVDGIPIFIGKSAAGVGLLYAGELQTPLVKFLRHSGDPPLDPFDGFPLDPVVEDTTTITDRSTLVTCCPSCGCLDGHVA